MAVTGQPLAAAGLTLTRSPGYLLNNKLGGLQSRFGGWGEENDFFPVPEIEPRFLSRPARN
jgi:hypothetical protein